MCVGRTNQCVRQGSLSLLGLTQDLLRHEGLDGRTGGGPGRLDSAAAAEGRGSVALWRGFPRGAGAAGNAGATAGGATPANLGEGGSQGRG